MKRLSSWGWINNSNGNDWFCRGWLKILRIQGLLDRCDRHIVIRTNLNILGTKKQFKVFSLYSIIHNNIKQQSYKARKSKNGIPIKGGILHRVYISCKKVASWFNVSEKTGSMYRRLMADFGFFSMVRRWEELPKIDFILRSYEERGRLLFCFPSGVVLSPICSELSHVDNDTIITGRRY